MSIPLRTLVKQSIPAFIAAAVGVSAAHLASIFIGPITLTAITITMTVVSIALALSIGQRIDRSPLVAKTLKAIITMSIVASIVSLNVFIFLNEAFEHGPSGHIIYPLISGVLCAALINMIAFFGTENKTDLYEEILTANYLFLMIISIGGFALIFYAIHMLSHIIK